MNETTYPGNVSDTQRPAGDPPAWVRDSSLLPGSETASPAAVGLLKTAVQGAHDTLDRLADRAAPALQKLGEGVSAAGQTLHAKTDQLRETGDEWVEGMRSTVRSKPLLSVAAALALGAVIAVIAQTTRITRVSR